MVAAVFGVVALAAVVLRPDSPPVPSEAFGRQFVSSCSRTGADELRCRCAYDRWRAMVTDDELAALDRSLQDGTPLAPDLATALGEC